MEAPALKGEESEEIMFCSFELNYFENGKNTQFFKNPFERISNTSRTPKIYFIYSGLELLSVRRL